MQNSVATSVFFGKACATIIFVFPQQKKQNDASLQAHPSSQTKTRGMSSWLYRPCSLGRNDNSSDRTRLRTLHVHAIRTSVFHCMISAFKLQTFLSFIDFFFLAFFLSLIHSFSFFFLSFFLSSFLFFWFCVCSYEIRCLKPHA